MQNFDINPNRLPFLQAQVLQKIYFDLFDEKQTSIDEIAEMTDYSVDSKILNDSVISLIRKGFLNGNWGNFQLPSQKFAFYEKIAAQINVKQKKYSEKNIFEVKNSVSQLFESAETISELNKNGIVHKWYDYLEDFPYELIEQKIIEYGLKPDSLVVEPFAGSGTTLISANFFGCNAVGFDANPLMCFISETKTEWNIDLILLKKEVENLAKKFLNNISQYENLILPESFIQRMPRKELNQWLSPVLQKETNLLKFYIEEIEYQDIKNLLKLILSKSCFEASYVSLCPGTTFYPFREKKDFWEIFTEKIRQVYFDLEKIQKFSGYGKSKLINDSCLNASQHLDNESIDFIITSPPYPNDLEYTRQTRLELYLLDFVKNMDDVQQIKRKMVKGSTKLIYKESQSENFIQHFASVKKVSESIFLQTKDKNWGFDYPRMVREYFGDMYLCFREFLPLLKKNAYFLSVVGDQTIKGVYIPVCEILIEMANELGYRNCRKELFRIRRSTGHNIPLPEEILIFQK